MINTSETREKQLAEDIKEAVQAFNLLCKEASDLGVVVKIGEIIGGNGAITLAPITITITLSK